MLENFGKNLVKELRKKNMTQTELSKKTGIHNANISYWIKGKTIPAVRSIEKVAKALDIPTSKLTEDNSNTNINQVIGNNNSNISQQNNDNNINIILNRLLIIEKEIEIIKLKLNNK